MKKIIVLVLALFSFFSISGCSYLFSRKIPVLGTEVGSKGACPLTERVYYYRDADVAICLPDVMVAYTHCVTELTVANTTSNFSTTTKADVTGALASVKGLTLTEEQKRDLEKHFEAAGVIGDARAKAISVCLDLTEKVYGNTPTIQAVPTKVMELNEKRYQEHLNQKAAQ